jgi:orotidine 5'-phosphate decarboxylase subfamily 1
MTLTHIPGGNMQRGTPFLTRANTPPPPVSTLSYEERAKLTDQTLAQRILNLMAEKETNLCVSADVETKAELLELARNVAPHICVLKIHYDIIVDFDQDTIDQLVALANEKNFIIFEDRKFADIGNTGVAQYARGKYRIADWATLVNAHTISGEDMVKAFKPIGKDKGNGILLLAQMSSKGNLIDTNYTQKTVEIAEAHQDFVIGFICQNTISHKQGLINFTPGVSMFEQGDAVGQTYNTPEMVIAKGADVIIVGRGIYAKKTPAEQIKAAEDYREAGWAAYQNRVGATHRLAASPA